jgi:hypothetical protein
MEPDGRSKCSVVSELRDCTISPVCIFIHIKFSTSGILEFAVEVFMIWTIYVMALVIDTGALKATVTGTANLTALLPSVSLAPALPRTS